MSWSTLVQIFINFGAGEAFLSRVQIWLYNPDFRLLGCWELDGACQPYYRENYVDRNGELIVQNGALLDLQ
jgi:hypothetical protein